MVGSYSTLKNILEEDYQNGSNTFGPYLKQQREKALSPLTLQQVSNHTQIDMSLLKQIEESKQDIITIFEIKLSDSTPKEKQLKHQLEGVLDEIEYKKDWTWYEDPKLLNQFAKIESELQQIEQKKPHYEKLDTTIKTILSLCELLRINPVSFNLKNIDLSLANQQN